MNPVNALDIRKAKLSLDACVLKCARYSEFLPLLRSHCFCLLFLGCLPFLALAQQLAPPTGAPAARPAAAEGQIKLDVVVTDKLGEVVSGLQSSDFTLLDNNRPATLLSFQAYGSTTPPETPVQVVLVIDNVNEGFDDVSLSKNDIEKFLRQNNGKLAQPTSIILFEDTKTQVLPEPSRDGNALLATFEKNVTGLRELTRSSGFYGAEDRLQISLKTLGELAAYEATKPGRKLVIWISPGWPLLSGPNIQISGSQQRKIFDSVVMLSTALRQAHMTLYNVDPLGTADAGSIRLTFYEEFLKGLTNPNKAAVGNLRLQVMAVQSGGRVLNASNDITAEINRCVADASAYYELAFDPAPAERPDEYHKLDIKVDKPGLDVRSSTGYYAQPRP